MAPSAVEGGEADVELAVRISPRVQGPQLGVRLAHAAEGIFHAARSDRATAGARVPARRRCAKIWRRGMGSGGKEAVSTPMLPQKEDQTSQALWADETRLAETRCGVVA